MFRVLGFHGNSLKITPWYDHTPSREQNGIGQVTWHGDEATTSEECWALVPPLLQIQLSIKAILGRLKGWSLPGRPQWSYGPLTLPHFAWRLCGRAQHTVHLSLQLPLHHTTAFSVLLLRLSEKTGKGANLAQWRHQFQPPGFSRAQLQHRGHLGEWNGKRKTSLCLSNRWKIKIYNGRK